MKSFAQLWKFNIRAGVPQTFDHVRVPVTNVVLLHNTAVYQTSLKKN